MHLRLLLVLVMLTLNAALAQTCRAELQAGLSAEELAQPATGVQAAELLERAVKLLEPALPPLRSALPTPLLEPGEAGFNAATFLLERGLLPGSWQPNSLSLGSWREMLQGLASWYRLAALEPSGDLSLAGLLNDLSGLVAAVAPSLRPVALVASVPGERSRVAFWAVIRNHSVYPRLLVFRPPDALVLEGGIAAALPLLSTCAQKVDNFVFAPADVAQRLFLANNRASMYLAATVPDDRRGLWLVPSGEEAAYLAFEAAALEPYSMYATVFEGPPANPAMLLRLIPQVRTNMNPRELTQLLLAN